MARILVVDDEDLVRTMLCSALEIQGHEVLEASDGAEALRLHRAAPADLVITDIHMPETNGLEVIVALRHEAPQLKIIAMSGGGRLKQTETLRMAEPLGAFAILRKPFDLNTMLETVIEALAA